jgi:esterase
VEEFRLMAEVHANGVRLYYEEHGHGDPILCIHGTSSSAMVWRPAAIDDLSALGRVILYDRRGCTRSERPDPYETSVVQHAEDAAAFALGARRRAGPRDRAELRRRGGRRARPEAPQLRPGPVLLEAASLTLDDEALAWAEELREAAARDVSAVAETFLLRVLGDVQCFIPSWRRPHPD